MLTKKTLHSSILIKLNERIEQLKTELKDTLDATANETKSSAGDKHETGRAMAQLEQEKLGGQINEVIKLKEALLRLNPETPCNTVCLGSMVLTSMGKFYISVGIGAQIIDGQSIFCMTPLAPICQSMLGKKAGDSISWQGNEIRIMSIS
ncbi:MAG: hypothetical protein ACK44B_06215 [Flavobacteriales bacterium]|jgi:transcription elongation GreA/GreB family factor